MTTATETLSETDRVFGKGIAPSTIFTADNLDVLRGMNSACIDLIYLDPPLSTDTLQSPFGSDARSYRDVWTKDLVRDEWLMDIRRDLPALDQTISAAAVSHSESMQAYLAYMGIRLAEMRRVLKDTGSIYLHCDPTASHYLKAAMDSIFGHRNFLDEVVWAYGRRSSGPTAGKKPIQAHDVLLVYAKSYGKHTYNIQRVEYPANYNFIRSSSGNEDRGVPSSHRRNGSRVYEYQAAVPLSNVWSDPRTLRPYQPDRSRQEATGFPTQKPRALLERIIDISSNQGEVVLDPFCGCATACIAAEGVTVTLMDKEYPSLQPAPRRWVGIDMQQEAYEIVVQRLETELSLTERGPNGQILTNAGEVQHKKIEYDQEHAHLQNIVGGDVPIRTDLPNEGRD